MKYLILSLCLIGLSSSSEKSLPKCPKSGKGRLSSFQGDIFAAEPCVDDKGQVVVPETDKGVASDEVPGSRKKRPSLKNIMPGVSSLISGRSSPRVLGGSLPGLGRSSSRRGIKAGIRPGVRPGLNIGGSSYIPPLGRSTGPRPSIQSLKKKVYTLLDLSASASKTSTRSMSNNDPPGKDCAGCVDTPIACCKTVSDVAFPTIGVSAITNQTVNIVQEFPSLVQAVFFRACEYEDQECDVVRGNCVQEFLPQSVFVIPETPIGGFFGQDFVLTESGCRCDATIYSAPSTDDGNGGGEERELKPRPTTTTTQAPATTSTMEPTTTTTELTTPTTEPTTPTTEPTTPTTEPTTTTTKPTTTVTEPTTTTTEPTTRRSLATLPPLPKPRTRRPKPARITKGNRKHKNGKRNNKRNKKNKKRNKKNKRHNKKKIPPWRNTKGIFNYDEGDTDSYAVENTNPKVDDMDWEGVWDLVERERPNKKNRRWKNRG